MLRLPIFRFVSHLQGTPAPRCGPKPPGHSQTSSHMSPLATSPELTQPPRSSLPDPPVLDPPEVAAVTPLPSLPGPRARTCTARRGCDDGPPLEQQKQHFKQGGG